VLVADGAKVLALLHDVRSHQALYMVDRVLLLADCLSLLGVVQETNQLLLPVILRLDKRTAFGAQQSELRFDCLQESNQGLEELVRLVSVLHEIECLVPLFEVVSLVGHDHIDTHKAQFLQFC
jgi:hypothetical protein